MKTQQFQLLGGTICRMGLGTLCEAMDTVYSRGHRSHDLNFTVATPQITMFVVDFVRKSNIFEILTLSKTFFRQCQDLYQLAASSCAQIFLFQMHCGKNGGTV